MYIGDRCVGFILLYYIKLAVLSDPAYIISDSGSIFFHQSFPQCLLLHINFLSKIFLT